MDINLEDETLVSLTEKKLKAEIEEKERIKKEGEVKTKEIIINNNFGLKIQKNKRKAWFNGLFFRINSNNNYKLVIETIPNILSFIELVKFFSSNKLKTEKDYFIGNIIKARIATKNKETTLLVEFKKIDAYIYLDKFQCSSLASVLSKYIGRCEPWEKEEEKK